MPPPRAEKREIQLLASVHASPGDRVTVLDISLDPGALQPFIVAFVEAFAD